MGKLALKLIYATTPEKTAKALSRKVSKEIKEALDNKDELDAWIDKIHYSIEDLIFNFPKEIDPKIVIQSMLKHLPQPFSPEEKQALASAFEGRGDWEWKPISFTEWTQSYKDILSQHNDPNNAALLIVDLQNDRESSLTTGEDVLSHWAKWASQNDATHAVFAIAFTSKLQPDEEIKSGREYTNKLFPEGPKKDQLPVLVLSKARLNSDAPEGQQKIDAAHEAFKKALSRLRACALHWSLAEDVQNIFTDSVVEAFKTLQELSIEELLMAVSGKHTHQEGASDVDTLVRMAAVAQRAALLTKIAENDKVSSTLIELRGLTEVFAEFNRKILGETSGIVKLRASEVYDPGEVVNSLLSPLATGDIFEIISNNEKEYYLLVSNICDLTLRGHTGRRKIKDGLLLKLEKQDARKGSEEYQPFKLLPNFPQSSPLFGNQWVANYNNVSIVPLEVLDLCWSNKGGYCHWDGKMDVVSRMAPSQKLRLEILLLSFEDIDVQQQIEKRLPGVEIKYTLPSDAEPLGNVLFDVRRVGRMAHTFAHAVSEGFGRNLSRHSFEHDMSAG